jgi:HD-like signal output (HDOD) protein
MTTNNAGGTDGPKRGDEAGAMILADLTEQDRVDLYKRGRSRKYQQGEIIGEHLPTLSSLYLVINGCVRLSASVHGGVYDIDFPANHIFGLLSAKHGTRLSFSLMAKESTTLMEVSAPELMSLPERLIDILYANVNRTLLNTLGTLLTIISDAEMRQQHFIEYIGKTEAQRRRVVSSSFVTEVLAKIPKLPSYTHDLLLRLNDEHVSTEEIVKTIQNDPSLAGRILKSVNSAYYGLSGKIADIYHAVVYLGFQNVYQLIVQQGINSILPDEQEFHEIQIKSSVVAILSQEIAVLSKRPSPMISATIGLLHNLGTIVIALLKRKNPHLCEVFALMDEAAIGATLLRNWGVPDKISAVILHQHQPEYTPPALVDPVYQHDLATLYLAKVCSGMLLGIDIPSMIFGKEYLALLDLQACDMTQLYRHAIVPALVKNHRKYPDTIRQILRQTLEGERRERV